MFLCKISFSSSSNARLPFSILKENKMLYLAPANGRCSVKKIFFCHVSMMWTLVDLFCKKRLSSQETAFFPQIILPEMRTEGIRSLRNSAVLLT